MTSRIRLAQAFCLALTLTFVPAILCAVTVGSGYSAYREFEDWLRRRADSIAESTYELLVVDREGRVAVNVHNSRNNTVQYLDAQRAPIKVDEKADWLVGNWLFRSPPPAHPLQRLRDVPIESLGRPLKDEEWFFVFGNGSPGRVVFEAYDTATNKPIGFIGQDGFHQGRRDESKGFPVDGIRHWGPNQILFARTDYEYGIQMRGLRFDGNDPLRAGQWALRSGDRLFVVDAVARSVTELLPGVPIGSVAAAVRIAPAVPVDAALPAAAGEARQFMYQKWLAVRTAEQIVLLNPDAGLREEFVLPPEWRERQFQLYLPADGTALLTSHGRKKPVGENPLAVHEYVQDVVAITQTGQIARQTSVTLQQPMRSTGPSQRTMHWLPTLAIPGPLPSAIIAGGAIPWLDAYIHQTRFSDRAVVSLSETWPVLVFVTLLAIGLTWRADRHLRAVREPRSLFWLAFVFLLGLPGYVAWYCHRHWPVRHPVAPPEKTGTEIFA